MKKRYSVTLVAVLLLAVTVLTAIPSSAAVGNICYDYSRPASSHNVTVDSAGIVDYYVDSELTEAERNYLTMHGGVSIKYDSGITTSYVFTPYLDGTLTVLAREYSYTSMDGTVLTWIPSSVTLDGVTKSFEVSDGEYTVYFYDVPENDDLAAYIDYTLDIRIDKNEVNRLINLAYNDAESVQKEITEGYAEYERLREEYEAGVIAYDTYLSDLLKYEADYAAYTEYVVTKKLYDDAKAEYDDYVAAKQKYETAVKEQEDYEKDIEEYKVAYAAYMEYVSAVEAYPAKLEAYNAYVKDITLVRQQLAALDSIKSVAINDRTVYNAVMGGTVTNLMQNESLLNGVGGDVTRVVYYAGYATEDLRKMMEAYFSLTDEQAKYQYYILNYEALRDAFVTLTQALENLYTFDWIRSGISLQDSTYPAKYEILISQLIVVSNVLSDGTAVYDYTGTKVLNRQTKIYCYASRSDKTVAEHLQNSTYIADSDAATPLTGGYPVAVEEPVYPSTVVKMPTMPTSPGILPAKPDEVADPGEAPEAVSKPTEPDEVKEPVEPEEYIPEPEKVALADAYREGKLYLRDELDFDPVYTAVTTVKKRLFNVDTVTVFFYSESGEFLESVSVDGGTRADFNGITPTKEEDDSAYYEFCGWVDKNGNDVDLSEVMSDIVVYPKFNAITKYYDVTFDIDGDLTVMSLPYGSTPEFPYTPARPDDELMSYTFTGWDKEISQVLCDAFYTATFSGEYHMPITSIGGSSSGASVTSDDSYIYADCTGTLEPFFDITTLVDYATESGSAKGIVIDSRYCTISVNYKNLLSMKANGDTVIDVSVIRSGSSAYSYCVNVSSPYGVMMLSDGDTVEQTPSYSVTVSVRADLPDTSGLRLYTVNADGQKQAVAYTYENGFVRFTATSGVKYVFAEEYELKTIAPSLGSLAVSADEARPGDRITLDIDLPQGVSLDRLYLIYPDGTEQDVSPDGFVMPSSAVTVAAKTSYTEYTVTFVDGDTVIASYVLHWGDKVTVPHDPSRADDGKYKYHFLHWSSEITDVTGSVVYEAVYEKVPIPQKTEEPGLKLSDSVKKLLIAAIVAVCMLVFAVIPAIVYTVIAVRRERRMYVGRSIKKGSDEAPTSI